MRTIRGRGVGIPLWIVLLAPVSGLSLDPDRLPSQYATRQWTDGDGLPTPTVYSLAQDSRGLLWVGTETGLVLFDGYGFELVDDGPMQPVARSHVTWIVRDGDTMVASAAGVGVAIQRPDSTVDLLTQDGLPSPFPTYVAVDADHRIWIGTDRGLAVWQPPDPAAAPVPGLSTQVISGVQIDASDTVWVGTESGLYTITPDRPAEPARVPSAPAVVHVVARAPDGSVWVAASHALWRLSPGREWARFAVADGLPSEEITSLLVDSDGVVWIGHRDRGLTRFHGGRFDPVPVLAGTTVLSLYEDRDGSLWVGTGARGLWQFRDPPIVCVGTPEGLSADDVWSVYEDDRGVVWLGTWGGGLNRVADGTVEVYGAEQGLSSATVWVVLRTPTGRLYAGTHEGLDLWDGARWRRAFRDERLNSTPTTALLSDRAGRLWIGTEDGLFCYANESLTYLGLADGLSHLEVLALLEDRAGALWIGTRGGGLSRLAEGAFQSWTTDTGFPSNRIYSLYEDSAGAIWATTDAVGLVRWDGREMMRIGREQGLPTGALFSVLGAANGDLWVSSNIGIIRVESAQIAQLVAGERRRLDVDLFGSADGLRTVNCNGGLQSSGWRSASGQLWFATAAGAAIVRPDRVPSTVAPPTVVVKDLVADDRRYDIAGVPVLPPGVRRLEIHYTGVDLSAPSRLRYQYRLEPYDDGWIDVGPRRTAYYTRIGPDTYTFEVRASTNGRDWGPAAVGHRFTITPHVYQTAWFLGLVLVAVAGLAWSGYAVRVRQLRYHYDLVISERKRIARELHDTLAQGLTGISIHLEGAQHALSHDPMAAEDHLATAGELVRASLDETRRSVWDLRADEASPRILRRALEELLQRAVRGTGIRGRFSASGATKGASPEREAHVLRLGQEAITNAVRHSGCGTITVQLRAEPDTLLLSIADDGRGLPDQSAANGGGFGLTGMQERVAILGGRMQVESEPGQGTCVTFAIPRDDRPSRGR